MKKRTANKKPTQKQLDKNLADAIKELQAAHKNGRGIFVATDRGETMFCLVQGMDTNSMASLLDRVLSDNRAVELLLAMKRINTMRERAAI